MSWPRQPGEGPLTDELRPVTGGGLARWQQIGRWLAVLAVLATAVLIIWRLVAGHGLTQEEIEQAVRRAGWWAPAVFVLAFAVVGSLLIPTTLLAIAGATLFGPLVGFAYSMAGAFAAALLGFSAARTLGRAVVMRWLGHSEGALSRLDRRLAENGFATSLLMRLIYLPNGLINVVCGISGISLAAYSAGTLLGLLPMVFAVSFVTVGAEEAFLSGQWSALWTPEVVLSALLFGACVSLPLLAGAWRRRAGHDR